MSVFTIDPLGMDVKAWTDAMHIDLEGFGSIPILIDKNRWQDWASELSNLGGLAGIVIPDPYEFSDWQDWARRFNESLGAIV